MSKKNFDLKNVFRKKILGQENFWVKKIVVKLFFFGGGSNRMFWSENFLGQKIVWVKRLFGSKDFLGQKTFWVKKVFGSSISHLKKHIISHSLSI